MSELSELTELIGRLSGARVLCVGDVMLDRFVEGRVERISPEGPIPVLVVERTHVMPGGAGNVVRNIADLGAASVLISAVGDDSAGEKIGDLLETHADLVEPLLLAVGGRRTSVKTRYIASGQQLLRADSEQIAPLEPAAEASLLEMAAAALPDCAAMVLSDYGKGVLGDGFLAALLEQAGAAKIPVIVDPKGADYSRYRGATLVTPNKAELAEASGLPTESDEEIVAACRKLVGECGIDGIVATRGARGMTLVSGDEVRHLPARAREVFDVSGAGDTVVAALAVGLAAGAPVPLAARLANVAAGIVVGKTGTAVARADEILAVLHEGALHDAEEKVASPASAVERIDAWRRRGLRIGFTNGCFDVLHPGHVSLLRQARDACDRLVVGLNGDESVRRLKGERRPVQDEAARTAVLASLASVDLVVIFHEDTPIDLIQSLKPDLLVKGADYTQDEVVGAPEVIGWGGELLLAEIIEGQSSSDIIEKAES